jgi:cell division protein FtsA
MSSPRLIVACDFGTTAFKALIAETTGDGGIRVLSTARVFAEGFEDGDFVDLRSGSRAIAECVRSVEVSADVDVSAFFYNISGSHLRSVWARGQVQVGPGPRAIRAGDLDAVLIKARSLAIPFDNWICAVNPVEYAVDRVRKVVNPLGRIGSQLEVEAHLITASRSVVRNIEHAIATAGYEVAGRGVDILASATAVLTTEERKEGVLLVDVGGRATNWALFRNDHIVGNGLVPWGGCHLTSDLTHGLQVSQEQAEQIKCLRGVTLRSQVEEATPEALFEEERPEETQGLVAAILEPRMEEIFSLVKKSIGDARQITGLGAGCVLTGGGSRCRGTSRLCAEVFGVPTVRRHLPVELADEELLAEGQWATAVGLSLWAAGSPLPEDAVTEEDTNGGGSIWGKVRRWLDRGPGGDRKMAAEG